MLRTWIHRLKRRSTPPSHADQDTPYTRWLAREFAARAKPRRRRTAAPRFSVLTTVFNTPPDLLQKMAESLFRQTAPGFEWILLDNGSDRLEVIRAIEGLASSPRVRTLRIDRNRGIIPGMRVCLEAAREAYVVAVDSDDLLVPDALQVLGDVIVANQSPPILYSDEDLLIDGAPQAPYLRPDWDPVLNLCTSYVFHLCAFLRTKALDLGVYTDERMNWCHDWDTMCRFVNRGERPVHIPAVLYHWRMHPQSSTNRPDPERGSLVSQRNVLKRQLEFRGETDRFDVEFFPISRGIPELWLRRRHLAPEPMHVVLVANDRGAAAESIVGLLLTSGYPFVSISIVGIEAFDTEPVARILTTLGERHESSAPGRPSAARLRCTPTIGLAGLIEMVACLDDALTLVYSVEVQPEGDEWPWEVQGLRCLHPDTVLFSGRVLNRDRIVVAGGEIFGFDGIIGCPDRGRPAHDPGYFALALKQRSVSAVHSAFFVAGAPFLRAALAALPSCATFPFLGAWLGAQAAERRGRVVFSPLVTASAMGVFTGDQVADPEQQRAFLERYGSLIPDRRWYSPHFSLRAGAGYTLEGPAAHVGSVVERIGPVLSSEHSSGSQNVGPVPPDPGDQREVQKRSFPRGMGGATAAR